MTDSLRVAILGAGRVGCSIHHGLTQARAPPTLLWTRSVATAAAAAAEGFTAITGGLPAIDADLILLAVEDSAVASLASELARSGQARSGAVVAHVAGALDLTPLAPLQAKGFAVGSFHPIVSVASRRTELTGAFAGIAGDAVADAPLAKLAALLRMSVVRPQGDRARYHAAAAVAGNFPQALLEAATRLLAECGLSAEESRQAFGPLLISAARNAAEKGAAAGLTGPVVRGDAATLARHLQAIATQPEVEHLYRSATALAIDLAEQRGITNFDALRALIDQ